MYVNVLGIEIIFGFKILVIILNYYCFYIVEEK